MNSEIRNRKGARKIQDIPSDVLELLNKGVIETVNLTEWLAINHIKLLEYNAKALEIPESVLNTITDALKAQQKPTAMSSIKIVGNTLFDNIKGKSNYTEIARNLCLHTADTIRCYAPYLIALNEDYTLREKLDKSMPLVADTHFGVREVVWMALRPDIDVHLSHAIAILSDWAASEDENVRRFTTEATRPRGVWCKHIEALKEAPELALPILEQLKADPSKYVQDSVGNWLNDAGKTRPEFVKELCEKWKASSPTKETDKIIKRATRSFV